MRLIDFIEKFDNSLGLDVEVYDDVWKDYETFIAKKCEYDLVFSGKMRDIPITYANCYMVDYETYIDWDEYKLIIYVRDRKGE